MNTIGERLYYIRKEKGCSQESLAKQIGVTRGVIYNLEKGLAKPQMVVINAICQTLKIRKEWLLTGEGAYDDEHDTSLSAKILKELYEIAKDLSEAEQLFLLDTARALKHRLGQQERP